MVSARREAVRGGETSIGTHHILLGVVARSPVVREVVGKLGMGLEDIRGAVAALSPPTGKRRPFGGAKAMQLTRAAAEAWLTAREVAVVVQSEEIGGLEVVAGLVAQRYGVAARVLTENYTRAPEEVFRCICEAAGRAGEREMLEWLMKAWARAKRWDG